MGLFGLPIVPWCSYCTMSELDCKIPRSKFKKCGRCKMVFYCCGEHQKRDWSFHKNMCVVDKKNSLSQAFIRNTIRKENPHCSYNSKSFQFIARQLFACFLEQDLNVKQTCSLLFKAGMIAFDQREVRDNQARNLLEVALWFHKLHHLSFDEREFYANCALVDIIKETNTYSIENNLRMIYESQPGHVLTPVSIVLRCEDHCHMGEYKNCLHELQYVTEDTAQTLFFKIQCYANLKDKVNLQRLLESKLMTKADLLFGTFELMLLQKNYHNNEGLLKILESTINETENTRCWTDSQLEDLLDRWVHKWPSIESNTDYINLRKQMKLSIKIPMFPKVYDSF